MARNAGSSQTSQRVDQGSPEQTHERPLTTESVEVLSRITRLEEGFESMKFIMDFVKSTNWFILIVLFVGFIALLLTVISGIIVSNKDITTTQIEFIKAVQQFSDKIATPTSVVDPSQ